MSDIIHKYRLVIGTDHTLWTPPDPVFVSAVMHPGPDGKKEVYIFLQHESPLEQRRVPTVFCVIGTDWPCPSSDQWQVLGSIFDGIAAWHIFQLCVED